MNAGDRRRCAVAAAPVCEFLGWCIWALFFLSCPLPSGSDDVVHPYPHRVSPRRDRDVRTGEKHAAAVDVTCDALTDFTVLATGQRWMLSTSHAVGFACDCFVVSREFGDLVIVRFLPFSFDVRSTPSSPV